MAMGALGALGRGAADGQLHGEQLQLEAPPMAQVLLRCCDAGCRLLALEVEVLEP